MIASVLAILGTIFALVGCVYPGSLTMEVTKKITYKYGLWSTGAVVDGTSDFDTFECSDQIFVLSAQGGGATGDDGATVDDDATVCMYGDCISTYNTCQNDSGGDATAITACGTALTTCQQDCEDRRSRRGGTRTRRGEEDACESGLESRCMAGRVFSIFGAVFAFAAIVSGAMKKSAMVIGLTNGIACFSTLLCMALLVQLKQGDSDLKKASCGMDAHDVEYDAGFISFVLAFILFLMATVVGCMSKPGAGGVASA